MWKVFDYDVSRLKFYTLKDKTSFSEYEYVFTIHINVANELESL